MNYGARIIDNDLAAKVAPAFTRETLGDIAKSSKYSYRNGLPAITDMHVHLDVESNASSQQITPEMDFNIINTDSPPNLPKESLNVNKKTNGEPQSSRSKNFVDEIYELSPFPNAATK